MGEITAGASLETDTGEKSAFNINSFVSGLGSTAATAAPASKSGIGSLIQGAGGLAAMANPIAGAVVALAGTAMSFAEAKKQRQNQVAAQLEADKAFQEAGRILEEQYMSGVSIPLGTYELEREAIKQAGAQATAAGAEGEQRGAGAIAGRVVGLQQDAFAKQRASLEERQFQLEKAKAEELMKLQQGRLGLQMGELGGQQMILADMRAQEAASRLSGVEGLSNLSTDIFKYLTPLYNRGEVDEEEDS